MPHVVRRSVRPRQLSGSRFGKPACGCRSFPCDADAVLLNASLADGTGQAFCALLRESGYTAPLIMLSGACDEAAIETSMAPDASEYVQKPIRLPTLMVCLGRHLSAAEPAA